MNPENYCAPEMARKLQEAGILKRLPTIGDRIWCEGLSRYGFVVSKPLVSSAPGAYEVIFDNETKKRYLYPSDIEILYPMAEAWRELPERQTINGRICEISFTKVGPFHVACYSWFYEAMSELFKTTNPTDALCELLMWGKGAKK